MLVFFFLIIDFHFLFPSVIAQKINPIAELVVPIGISSKELNKEVQVHPVVKEDKTKKVFNKI